jgi:hypothetical protein
LSNLRTLLANYVKIVEEVVGARKEEKDLIPPGYDGITLKNYNRRSLYLTFLVPRSAKWGLGQSSSPHGLYGSFFLLRTG